MFSKRRPGVFPPAAADPGRLQSAETSISNAHFCRMTPVCAVDPIAAATTISTWHLLLHAAWHLHLLIRVLTTLYCTILTATRAVRSILCKLQRRPSQYMMAILTRNMPRSVAGFSAYRSHLITTSPVRAWAPPKVHHEKTFRVSSPTTVYIVFPARVAIAYSETCCVAACSPITSLNATHVLGTSPTL
jgi:hypothetical protein